MIIDKDKFIKSYNKIVKGLNSDSSNIIFLYTSEFENDNFENLLDLDNNIFKNYIMWIRKSKKFKFLSLGCTQECNLSNQNKIQFNSMVETLIKNSISMNLSDQKNIPMFIGGQNFNIKINNSKLWEDVPIAKYLVPKILLMKDNKKITITHFFKLSQNAQKIINTIELHHNYLLDKIKSNENNEVKEIKAEPVSQVLDSTGAGDLYAAGFLFGMTRQKNYIECGRLASIASAETISHFGARPQVKLSSLI